MLFRGLFWCGMQVTHMRVTRSSLSLSLTHTHSCSLSHTLSLPLTLSLPWKMIRCSHSSVGHASPLLVQVPPDPLSHYLTLSHSPSRFLSLPPTPPPTYSFSLAIRGAREGGGRESVPRNRDTRWSVSHGVWLGLRVMDRLCIFAGR